MKRKIIISIIMVAILLIPSIVLADGVDTDAIMKRIAPDLENATFKMKKPTTPEEADFNVSGYVGNFLGGDYWVYGYCMEPYTTCTITFQSHDYDTDWDSEQGKVVVKSGWMKEYVVNATWEAPEDNETINSYMSALKNGQIADPSTYYAVTDLALVNYYLTGSRSELWNVGAAGRALKFSSLNDTTKGANITYYIDTRAGNQDKDLMYESSFGPMSIFYNGYLYGAKEEGVYLRRVIYVPESTTDTKEAFIAAAQERITDYLGDNSVTVSYGGTLDDLNETVKQEESQRCIDNGNQPEDCKPEEMMGAEDDEFPVVSDGNYYLVKVGDRTYNFYIVKGTEAQLKAPTYNAIDINSKIEISSEDSSIPLDASVTASVVNDSSLKDKVGTENYKAYDISVRSDAKGTDITELSNGKFLVRIPVPDELKDKEKLTIWYIPSSGEKEEHEVTPKTIDGKLYAEFETNHFSTYVLAEAVEELTILEGNNQTYYKGSNKTITIVASGKLQELQGVEIDNGNPLREEDYILEEGSTKLTLKTSFLENSSLGDHYINFRFENGEVEAKLTIAEKQDEEEEETPTPDTTPDEQEEEKTNDEKENNPKTSDDIKQSFILLVISFIVLISSTVYEIKYNK